MLPSFAIVGHPNKGKSSIVASLSYDENVNISTRSGTTTQTDVFELKVDEELVYTLYDTPGFQRPREVLGLIQAHITDARSHAYAVKMFVQEYRGNTRYADEIALLSPIVDGAGILYVVDGSKPYSPEYEAQMQILRFTAAPSMALINMIGEEDYAEQWKDALSQYFKIVRMFNPLTMTHKKHMNLLHAMAQLKEEWTDTVERAIRILENREKNLIDKSVALIVQTIDEALSLEMQETLSTDADASAVKEALKIKYEERLISFEHDAKQQIKALWKHANLEIAQVENSYVDEELLSEKSQMLFGLSKKELLKTAAMSGAVAGGGFDLLVGGSSFMLGATLGAVLGAGGSYLGYHKIGDIRVMGHMLSSTQIAVGPMKNTNFAYILLARLMTYTKGVMGHAHANKHTLHLEEHMIEQLIDKKEIKVLEKQHQLMRHKSDKKELTVYKEIVRRRLLS